MTSEKDQQGESYPPESPGSLQVPTLDNNPSAASAASASSSQVAVDPESPTKRGILSATRIRSVITAKDIHVGYAFYTIIALSTAFASYTQSTYTAYATSAFKSHSQLSTAGVVSRVFSMVAYAMVPKLTDNIGRISPWLFASFILLSALSDGMMAGCKNVQTYIGANVFSGLSDTAYELTAQIYIAETTNIVSRAFWNVAADSLSSIVTLYSGAEIGGRILNDLGVANGWRWGYGMWSIITPVLSVPFIALLFSWHRRANRTPNLEPLPPRRPVKYLQGLSHGRLVSSLPQKMIPTVQYARAVALQALHEYDLVGMSFLVAAIALILVPLTLAKGVASSWNDSNVAMICCGFGCLLLFVIWSLPSRARPSWLFAPQFPLIPWHTLKNRSVLAMFVINLFDFMSYGILSIYYSSYLQVAVRVSPAKATMIDNTIRIVFQVTAIVMGLVMRFWTPLCLRMGYGPRLFHTRWAIWIGIPICVLSMGLTIHFVQHPRTSSAIGCFVAARLLYGIGRGMFQTSSQVAVQAAAKRNDLAIATGIFYLAMSLGGAIGVALAGAIWLNTLPSSLASNLPAESVDLAPKIYGSIAVAIKYDPSSAIGQAIARSYVHTMKIISIVAACLQVPMLVGMMFVQDVALDEDEQVVHGGKRIAMNRKKSGDDKGTEADVKG